MTVCKSWSSALLPVVFVFVSLLACRNAVSLNDETAEANVLSNFEFDASGAVIRRQSIGYVAFLDQFPALEAHRAAAYVDRYIESSNMRVTKTDLSQPDIQSNSQLINIFFGKEYFSHGTVNDSLVGEKYNRSVDIVHVNRKVDPFVYFEYFDGCAVHRDVSGYEIGESFVVVSDELDADKIDMCLYYSISYSYGFVVNNRNDSVLNPVRRNSGFLLYSSSRRCVDKNNSLEFARCTLSTFRESVADKI